MKNVPNGRLATEVFTGLLAREVECKPAPAPFMVKSKEKLLLAEYITDDNQRACIGYCDYNFAAYAGAALSLVPKPVAEEDLKKGELSESLIENTYELLNVAASIFNKPGVPHVRLKAVTACPPLPDWARAMSRKPSSRLDLRVGIEGYGIGRVSFAVS